jgi:cytochrome c-type biogenesis protein CcmH/NrfF
MTAQPSRRSPGRLAPPVVAGALALVAAVLIGAWAGVVVLPGGSGGTLDARVNAIGATVRCPACPEPISVNDSQNPKAWDTRQYIRDRLQHGASAGQIRQELVDRYGPSILLEPPQQGFDALVWLVPLVAVVLAGAVALVTVRRWLQRTGTEPPLDMPALPIEGPEHQTYQDRLDRELAARE